LLVQALWVLGVRCKLERADENDLHPQEHGGSSDLCICRCTGVRIYLWDLGVIYLLFSVILLSILMGVLVAFLIWIYGRQYLGSFG
jgi:hypothetical protein